MPSIQKRGDKFLAQVRIKQGGVVIFSESKVFETEVMAKSWGDRLEAKVKKEGPAKHSASKITVGELVDGHAPGGADQVPAPARPFNDPQPPKDCRRATAS